MGLQEVKLILSVILAAVTVVSAIFGYRSNNNAPLDNTTKILLFCAFLIGSISSITGAIDYFISKDDSSDIEQIKSQNCNDSLQSALSYAKLESKYDSVNRDLAELRKFQRLNFDSVYGNFNSAALKLDNSASVLDTMLTTLDGVKNPVTPIHLLYSIKYKVSDAKSLSLFDSLYKSTLNDFDTIVDDVRLVISRNKNAKLDIVMFRRYKTSSLIKLPGIYYKILSHVPEIWFMAYKLNGGDFSGLGNIIKANEYLSSNFYVKLTYNLIDQTHYCKMGISEFNPADGVVKPFNFEELYKCLLSFNISKNEYQKYEFIDLQNAIVSFNYKKYQIDFSKILPVEAFNQKSYFIEWKDMGEASLEDIHNFYDIVD